MTEQEIADLRRAAKRVQAELDQRDTTIATLRLLLDASVSTLRAEIGALTSEFWAHIAKRHEHACKDCLDYIDKIDTALAPPAPKRAP